MLVDWIGTANFLAYVFSDFYFFAVTDLIAYGDLYGLIVLADFCSPMFKYYTSVPNYDFPFGEI